MPMYDCWCKNCDNIDEDVFKSYKETHCCSVCDYLTVHVCNTKSFKLLYDPKKDTVGWSNDGYATTQYWKEYKKQKSEGKDVRIPQLDGE